MQNETQIPNTGFCSLQIEVVARLVFQLSLHRILARILVRGVIVRLWQGELRARQSLLRWTQKMMLQKTDNAGRRLHERLIYAESWTQTRI